MLIETLRGECRACGGMSMVPAERGELECVICGTRERAMDEATVEYLRCLAERLYNDALALDVAGQDDMATAHLELTMAVQKEIAANGAKVFSAAAVVTKPR